MLCVCGREAKHEHRRDDGRGHTAKVLLCDTCIPLAASLSLQRCNEIAEEQKPKAAPKASKKTKATVREDD